MSRDFFREGEDDAEREGIPDRRRYLIGSAYAEGFDHYMRTKRPGIDWQKNKSFKTVLLELRERVTVPEAKETIDHALKTLCHKCGDEAQPDTDPPMCINHMAQKGGGNDESTAEITHLMFINQKEE